MDGDGSTLRNVYKAGRNSIECALTDESYFAKECNHIIS